MRSRSSVWVSDQTDVLAVVQWSSSVARCGECRVTVLMPGFLSGKWGCLVFKLEAACVSLVSMGFTLAPFEVSF